MAEQTSTGPKRSRNTEIRQERRRRRANVLDGTEQKLSVQPEILDENKGVNELRWINDHGPRMYNKTEQDDWDPVTGPDGAVVKRHVGTDKAGNPIQAILCRKPQKFCAEDRAQKARLLDEQMAQIRTGQSNDPNSVQADGSAYKPSVGIKIQDGRSS